jgi:AraC family transcriptional regulator
MTLKHRGDFHGTTLFSREVPGFALRETEHEPGVRIPKHSHDRAHLGFVLRGAFIERCERKTLECKPLSVSFLAPGMAHSDEFHTGAHCFVLEFAPQSYDRVREHLRLDEPIYFYGGLLAWLTRRLYCEARRMDTASPLAIEGWVLEILAEASRQQMASSGRKPPRWLERAKELLHARFSETLTHDMIAHLVGVHPVHLASAFRHHYRCTIGEYVRHLRIEFACRKISTSEASLTDIALAAGFYDQSHFSKAFRQLTGMTPAQFRRSIRAS